MEISLDSITFDEALLHVAAVARQAQLEKRADLEAIKKAVGGFLADRRNQNVLWGAAAGAGAGGLSSLFQEPEQRRPLSRALTGAMLGGLGVGGYQLASGAYPEMNLFSGPKSEIAQAAKTPANLDDGSSPALSEEVRKAGPSYVQSPFGDKPAPEDWAPPTKIAPAASQHPGIDNPVPQVPRQALGKTVNDTAAQLPRSVSVGVGVGAGVAAGDAAHNWARNRYPQINASNVHAALAGEGLGPHTSAVDAALSTNESAAVRALRIGNRPSWDTVPPSRVGELGRTTGVPPIDPAYTRSKIQRSLKPSGLGGGMRSLGRGVGAGALSGILYEVLFGDNANRK